MRIVTKTARSLGDITFWICLYCIPQSNVLVSSRDWMLVSCFIKKIITKLTTQTEITWHYVKIGYQHGHIECFVSNLISCSIWQEWESFHTGSLAIMLYSKTTICATSLQCHDLIYLMSLQENVQQMISWGASTPLPPTVMPLWVPPPMEGEAKAERSTVK